MWLTVAVLLLWTAIQIGPIIKKINIGCPDCVIAQFSSDFDSGWSCSLILRNATKFCNEWICGGVGFAFFVISSSSYSRSRAQIAERVVRMHGPENVEFV
jgi:hypothetical protein